jgi:Ion transport protein
VLISAIDIILSFTAAKSDTGSGAITALRIFRLVRVFQLAKVWKDFNELLAGVQNTLKDISNMTVLMVIFVFTCMLIGMELYAF